jgi:pimeloyl-ACP methyl ester carboxylesterase
MSLQAVKTHGIAPDDFSVLFGDVHRSQMSVVIFGPVAPVWQGADFCMPLVELLLHKGYCVRVVDSVFPLMANAHHTVDQTLKFYADYVDAISQPKLLAGYALGGTLAMILGARCPGTARILSLSGPGYMDEILHQRLNRLNEDLAENRLEPALNLLAQFVAPLGHPPGRQHSDLSADRKLLPAQISSGCTRMKRGFELLMQLDARAPIEQFEGKVLAIVGAQSQLVNLANSAVRSGLQNHSRSIVEIADSGMRVLLDNPRATLAAITDWLDK